MFLYLYKKTKMRLIIIALILIINFASKAQTKIGISGDINWLTTWTNFKPKNADYKPANVILTNNIDTNTKFTSDNIYLLVGTVRVINNATLTIEAGTVVRGESKSSGALMVCKGSKIIANGSESYPIVFTSDKSSFNRRAGDWGGLIILGDAPTNTFESNSTFGFDKHPIHNLYGGSKIDDDSGSLQFVRIEFGGKDDASGYSSNGISLAGVGSKTVLSNIMVSDSADDSFQIYGGILNLNKVVSLRSGDDDFDFTEGAQCTIANGLAVRYPYITDPLRSRCLEIESYKKIALFDPTKKKTKIELKNVTFLENEVDDKGLIKEAIFLHEDAYLNLENVLVTGFKSFIAFDDFYFEKQNYKNVQIKNSVLDNCKTSFSDMNDTATLDTEDMLSIIDEWFSNPKNNFTKSEIGFKNLFIEHELRKQPDFRMK